MVEIKRGKKNLIMILFLILILLIIITIGMFISGKMLVKASAIGQFNPEIYEKLVDKYDITRYYKKAEPTWNGKYQAEYYKTSQVSSSIEILSYFDYSKEIKKINKRLESSAGFEITKIKKKYHNPTCNYIVMQGYLKDESDLFCIGDIFIEGEKVIITRETEVIKNIEKMSPRMGYFIAIPTDLPVTTKVSSTHAISKSEAESGVQVYKIPKK